MHKPKITALLASGALTVSSLLSGCCSSGSCGTGCDPCAGGTAGPGFAFPAPAIPVPTIPGITPGVPSPFSGGRTMAIPDVVPLGAISRAHWHTMETNAEATDFVINRNEFNDNSAELTPYGRDHIMEIAARMSGAPFPVLVERSLNNSDPELDAMRRNLVAQILTDLGNPDADRRTVVSQPYSNGINSLEGESEYARFRTTRGGGGNNNGGGFGGGGGGFGGGGF